MRSAVRLSSMLLGLAATLPALAAPSPAPGAVRVSKYSRGGSGCPPSVGPDDLVLSTDGKTLTFRVPSFSAQKGPGTPPSASRRSCQVGFSLDMPPGWSFAVSALTVKGSARLNANVTGIQSSLIYFSGESASAERDARFSGPKEGAFSVRHEIPEKDLVWSRCGAGALANVKTSVRLRAAAGDPSQGQSSLTVSSPDEQATATQIFELKWKRCGS